MQTIIIAKTAVFNDGGKLLAMRRSADDAYRPGGFDMPGGNIEPDESIVDGVIREALEESGIRFGKHELRLVFATTSASHNIDVGAEVNIVWLGFIAKLPKDQKVRLSHEHQSFDWVEIGDAIKVFDSPTQKPFMEAIRDRDLINEISVSR
jgi:8-oxo-dGTP pyrophosphatase MutT (NUDIX family)